METVFLSKSLDESAGGLLPVMQKLASNLRDFGVRVTAMGVAADNKQEAAPGGMMLKCILIHVLGQTK